MTIFHKKNGILVPKEKPQPEPPPKPERLKKWDCPHCGEPYDTTKQENWEYTIGRVGPGPWIPHIICPHCKECMGCHDVSEDN